MAQFTNLNETATAIQVSNPNISSSLYSDVIVYLGLIIAFILLLAFLVKKFSPNSLRQSKQIKIIDSVNLGQKEKIVLIEVNKTRLIVGVAQHSINLLDKYEHNEVELLEENSVKQLSSKSVFSQILNSAKKSTTTK